MPDSIQATAETLERAKKVFTHNCKHCHGANGAGDGPISKMEKIIVPSYIGGTIANLTPGQMFYSITYGKNAMGAHASQVTAEDRWRLVHYIYKLQNREINSPTPAPQANNAR
jgi:mono/diheme cytochrome c family protein